MKYLFLLSFAFPVFGFQSIGVSHSCGVGISQVQWHEEALRDLYRKASSRCGETEFPVQITPAVINEAANCIHYTGGAIAHAEFSCILSSASTPKHVTIVGGVIDPDCIKSKLHDPEIENTLSKLMRKKADSVCGITEAAQIISGTFKSSCQDSYLTGAARYFCIW